MKGKVIASEDQLIDWSLSSHLETGGIYIFTVDHDDVDYLRYGEDFFLSVPVDFVEPLL